MKKGKLAHWALALAVLLVFMGIVAAKMHGFKLMPGNLIDNRLNNYFLENVWQYLRGNSDSLVHLGFFWPFPFILGFSDNLWGSAPLYCLIRVFGADPYRAFQIWYYIGYVANFAAALWVLRRLRFSVCASLVGAVFFAFNLPESWQMAHAQLHWRMATPVALYYAYSFLLERRFSHAVPLLLWTVFQFWLGVYNGAFLTLMLLAMAAVAAFRMWKEGTFGSFCRDFWKAVCVRPAYYGAVCAAVTVLMALLFCPYLTVRLTYGFDRDWGEITTMLPHVASYFLMDESSIYGRLSQKIAQGIPMRWEHQIFIGIGAMVLLAAGVIYALRHKEGARGKVLSLSLASLGVVFLVTLYLGDKISLYYPLSKIPLFSSTRAMSRVILVMLFPMAVLMAGFLDAVAEKAKVAGAAAAAVFLGLMFWEVHALEFPISPKGVWDDRLSAVRAVTQTVRPGEILALGQQKGEGDTFLFAELDAMWASVLGGFKTINGYSGFYPPGSIWDYGTDCREIERRLVAALRYGVRLEQYKDLKIRAIGMEGGCQKQVQGLFRDIAVKPGERYGVGRNASPQKIFFIKGWSVAEDWGVWTDQKKAVLQFEMPEGNLPSEALLEVNYLTKGGVHPQSVKVSVNGRPVLELTAKQDSGELVLPLPAHTGTVSIAFELPNAASPPESGDER